MKPSEMIIAFLLVSASFIGIGIFAADAGSEFSKSVDIAGFNQTTQIETAAQEFKANTTDKLTDTNIVSQAIIGVTGFIELMTSITGTMFGLWHDLISNIFGVTTDVSGAFVAIFLTIGIIIIIFMLISAVVNRDI